MLVHHAKFRDLFADRGVRVKRILYILIALAQMHPSTARWAKAAADRDGDYRAGSLEQPDQGGGTLVWKRTGEPLNPEEGARVLLRAAERGDEIAQANLGFAYMRGIGVARDDVLARRWSRKAAEAGVPTAHVNLAYLHLMGRGGPQSYLLAYKHYFVAAYTSSPEENYLRGRWYETARNYPLTVLFLFTAAGQRHGGAAAALMKYLGPPVFMVILLALIFLRAGLGTMKKLYGEAVLLQCLSSRWTPCFKFLVSALLFGLLGGGVILVWLGALDDFVVREKLFANGRWMAMMFGMITLLYYCTLSAGLKFVAMEAHRFHISNYVRRTTTPVQHLTRAYGRHVMWVDFIVLEFAEDTGFGRRIVFMPPLRLLPLLSQHPMLTELSRLATIVRGNSAG